MSATAVIQSYCSRSSVHGIAHSTHSQSHTLRVAWMFLTLGSAGFLMFHIHRTVHTYVESPVQTLFIKEGQSIEFPDFTFCNLKPISQALLDMYKPKLYSYLRTQWNFFDNWSPNETFRRTNETTPEYNERLQDIFRKYLTTFWLSDSSQELSTNISSSVIHCRYNGAPCDIENDFRLVQEHHFWNCYTFHPTKRSVPSISTHPVGLEITLFQDVYYLESSLDDTIRYTRIKNISEEQTTRVTMEDYLSTEKKNLNDLLSGSEFLSEGLNVFIHNPDEYPFHQRDAFNLIAGRLTDIIFYQTNYEKQNRPNSACFDSEPPKLYYVTSFKSASSEVQRSEFSKKERETVVAAIQEAFVSNCSCYSHLYPTEASPDHLCYYAPPDNWTHPSDYVLERIECHDRIVPFMDELSHELSDEAKQQRPCRGKSYFTTVTQSLWPRVDDYKDLLNNQIMPKFHREDYSSLCSQFDFIKDSKSSCEIKPREQLFHEVVFNQLCDPNFKNRSIIDAWCASVFSLDRYLIRVHLKPGSSSADLYKEHLTYEWPEVLSEVGGTLGLWTGMSLPTIFEVFELVILLCFRKRRLRHNRTGMNNHHIPSPRVQTYPTNFSFDNINGSLSPTKAEDVQLDATLSIHAF